MTLRTTADAIQVRCPDRPASEAGFFHGVAYGSGFGGITAGASDVGGAYFSGTGSARTYELTGAGSPGAEANWTRTTAPNGGGTAPASVGVVDAGVIAWLESATLACCGSFEPPVVVQKHGYRCGFQGQEKDNEIYGSEGTSYAFEYRMHDARVGRFLSIDPLAAKYPQWSPYVFSGNQVITSRELEGLEPDEDLNNVGPAPTGTKALAQMGTATGVTNGAWAYPETGLQKATRTAYTGAANAGNLLSGGQWAQSASDGDVTPYQFFYQWVHGTGPDSRSFDENSTMGVGMLNAPEVQNEMYLAACDAIQGNCTPRDFARRLETENPVNYALNDFPRDVAGRNPARGFHGSFSGTVTALDVVDQGERGVLVTMNVNLSDHMTAQSGTRASGTVGGYDPVNPTAVYKDENPYGTNGQFRTIDVQYRMQVTVLLRPVHGTPR